MHAAPRFADVSAPLWDPAFEHDSCGVGLVVDIAGRPSRQIVERALAGLVNLTHRGGVGADSRTGAFAAFSRRYDSDALRALAETAVA